MLSEDYKDMLRALSDEKVKFLPVGAFGASKILAKIADNASFDNVRVKGAPTSTTYTYPSVRPGVKLRGISA